MLSPPTVQSEQLAAVGSGLGRTCLTLLCQDDSEILVGSKRFEPTQHEYNMKHMDQARSG